MAKETERLSGSFFCISCESLARQLLGQVIVRLLPDGTRQSGVIVETECYLGGEDKASHSYNGKRTERNVAMFMKPGTSYVYRIYGIYNCLNISSEGAGAAVLIRSLQPMEGLETMQKNRRQRRKDKRQLPPDKLCNGPSKLCQALTIEKDPADRQDLTTCDFLWLEKGDITPSTEIVTTKRVGIDSAGAEWAQKPLRFYIRDCKYVSKRDRIAEKITVPFHT